MRSVIQSLTIILFQTEEAKLQLAEVEGETVDHAAKLKLIKQEEERIKLERAEEERVKKEAEDIEKVLLIFTCLL